MTPTARILGAPPRQSPPRAPVAPAAARRSGAPAGRVHRRGTALSMALSATLHLTALAAFATIGPSGEPSGGSGGAMLVTLVGSDAALAALAVAATLPEAAAAPGELDRTLAPLDTTAPRELDPLAAATAPTSEELTIPRPPRQPAAPSAPDGVVPAAPRAEPGPSTTAAADPPPRPRPANLPPSRAAQAEARQTSRAAGSGGAPEAGPRAAAAVATGVTAARASAIDTWKTQIHRALQRSLPVPRGFDRATRDLRVTLALRVAPDGRLRAAELRRSSGDPTLDAAALRSVRRMGRLPRAPAGLTDPAYDFDAPVDLEAP